MKTKTEEEVKEFEAARKRRLAKQIRHLNRRGSISATVYRHFVYERFGVIATGSSSPNSTNAPRFRKEIADRIQDIADSTKRPETVLIRRAKANASD